MVSERVMVSIMKAAAWERAKGELRAVAALAGSHTRDGGSGAHADALTDLWEAIDQCIESFIEAFEGDGFHE